MTQNVVAGEEQVEIPHRTVVVGVKMDSQSRELLTWALVKVAQSGDRVIALHVLNENEIVDRDGKSSLLSLVKAFDSVLAVYEGFCNLKQVDLKLKICRGSAIRKILVREAKSYFATEVIVGTARNHHKLRSSVSIAKYCARKLSKHCSVLAVNNGKIAFQKEASSGSNVGAKAETILLAFQNYILVLGTSVMIPTLLVLLMGGIDSTEESSADGSEDKSMAIVPVQKLEGASSSISLLMRELPELRSGWSFLHRIISSHRKAFDRPSVRQISVVQWEMRLPSRNCLSFSDSDERESCLRCNQGQYSELNEENGAIVPFCNETLSGPSSPSTSTRSLPEELEGLNEKYSATCRLFQYEELLLATSKFKPENMIEKGGSSQVYRGCLPDGKELAMKILKQSEDVLKEFILEIEIITEDSEGIRPS